MSEVENKDPAAVPVKTVRTPDFQVLGRVMSLLAGLNLVERRRVIVYLNDWFNAEAVVVEAAAKVAEAPKDPQ